MIQVRTDLAIEAKELYEKQNNRKIPGVDMEEFQENEMKVVRVIVNNAEGEKEIRKPMGTYITIDLPQFAHYDNETMDDVSKIMSKYLTPLIKISPKSSVLVVGLGNWNITPDAVGPKVISKLMVTRHLKQYVPDSIDEKVRPVCAIAPGVLGITGIETGEIIKGVVEKVKPGIIICIDALASRKMERVNNTIQIGNTGIAPGSGVGNRRMELSEKTLGIPVIAIGVPTVVDAATMANDTIDLVLDEMIKLSKQGGQFYSMLKSIDKNEKQKLIAEVLNPYVGDLMVTPKEVDIVIDSVSKIIANGINLTLQPDFDIEYISKFVN